jgi:hypothetical protein
MILILSKWYQSYFWLFPLDPKIARLNAFFATTAK